MSMNLFVYVGHLANIISQLNNLDQFIAGLLIKLSSIVQQRTGKSTLYIFLCILFFQKCIFLTASVQRQILVKCSQLNVCGSNKQDFCTLIIATTPGHDYGVHSFILTCSGMSNRVFAVVIVNIDLYLVYCCRCASLDLYTTCRRV